MNIDNQNSCPLCEKKQGREIREISYDSIWTALENEWGAKFDQQVILAHTPGEKAFLLECMNCGLHFFSPAVPGNSDFYSQLTSTARNYYNDDKWDFHATLENVEIGDGLLDIACGSGAWLRRAHESGCKICGVDTNPDAIAKAKQQGFEAECRAIEEYARDNAGRFDVVTAFQVIEHIPSVLPFVKAAADCLNRDGKLILTVPNRSRSFKRVLEPLDCPPHHLSHWSAEQFAVLAQLTGLTLKAVHYEPSPMTECRALVRRKVASSRHGESLWARAIARAIFAPTLYNLYVGSGLLDRWQLRGMSLMAVLQK